MKRPEPIVFDPYCRACPRLAEHLDAIGEQYPHHHAAPVPAFGASDARLLIVGMAPGLHGANATGRPFTGDYAGNLLYRALHTHGFSNCIESRTIDDGLELIGCRITNAVKCLPPQNKPKADEVNRCNRYLRSEIHALESLQVILALGHIAHRAVLKSLSLPTRGFEFEHHRVHHLNQGMVLVDSYHCSRYNVQTKRLSAAMFDAVFATVARLLQ